MLWKEPATSFACNLEGVVRSLVARSVFKTDGGRIPSLVGSIPIYSRQLKQLDARAMLNPQQHKAYCAFYDSVRDTEHLDRRTAAMIGLAAAMARECQP